MAEVMAFRLVRQHDPCFDDARPRDEESERCLGKRQEQSDHPLHHFYTLIQTTPGNISEQRWRRYSIRSHVACDGC